MGNKIKVRAERNGKIRRTVAQIEQTVCKLERLKDEYLQKAADSKARGEQASYELCKSALNTTLTQIKRAKEMLLNIQITSELQKMGETNADFLTGMSVVAKRISKINKQSDFVKLQKEIQKALTGMEEAQAGLEVFLNSADAHFAAIAQTNGALSDKQIDALISGKATERDIMMDARLDAVMNDVSQSIDSTETPQKVALAEGGTAPEAPRATAKPFPSPRGAFDFGAGKNVRARPELFGSDGELPLRKLYSECEYPSVAVQAETGETVRVRLSDSPLIVCGDVGVSMFLHGALCSLVTAFSAAQLRLVAVDLYAGELSAYDGTAHSAADAVTGVEGVMPTLDALSTEISRRCDEMNAVGAFDIDGYNASAERKLPYIVVVTDGLSNAMSIDGFERELLRQMRAGASAGVYYILATRNTDDKTLTRGILGTAKSRIVSKMSDIAACMSLGAQEAIGLGGDDMLVYVSADGQKAICRAPYISPDGVRAVVNVLKENVI